MNRKELQALLDRAGIDPQAYTFNELSPSEKYALHESGASWVVYYGERGKQNDMGFFASEDEACRRLLDILLADPGARSRG